MTTAEYFGLARPHRASAFGSAAAFVRTTFDTWPRWRRMRTALFELRELDDRLLYDIGLERAHLTESVRERHGFEAR